MATIVMPQAHPVSTSFSIAGYRDVDAASDQSAYFGYLDSVAKVFHEVIASGIDTLRLRSGDAVVDVGCGHGASAALLADQVGPSGRVVGIDASHAMIAEARRRFARSGRAVEFQEGDALALPFADASFDAARADRVFMFLDDPERALAELVRVTKPGGRIVVTEGDLGSHAVDAGDIETTRAVLAALSDRAPNGWIGRRLRAMFVDAGLRDINQQLIPIVTTSFTEWNHRMGVERFLSNVTDQAIVPRDRALAWLDDLRARDAKGRFTGVAMLYLVAGTRSVL
ncbi:MAG: methyltransferase domain-containing protein [Burkholderiales bacterium]